MQRRSKEELAEERLQRLLRHLPDRLAQVVHGLRRPQARWQRIPIALLFLLGGVFGFLPILGVWMLPLGLLLLAEDIPLLRSALYSLINWLAKKRPRWFQ